MYLAEVKSCIDTAGFFGKSWDALATVSGKDVDNHVKAEDVHDA